MLALVMAVALAQCTKDTDCKGDRVCSAGECVDASLVPAPVQQVEALRLQRELADLHAELEDTTLGAPIVKLVGGVALIVAAGFLGKAYSENNRATEFGVAGIVCLGVGVALAIWGGVQFPLRLSARSRLQDDIRLREQQLATLAR